MRKDFRFSFYILNCAVASCIEVVADNFKTNKLFFFVNTLSSITIPQPGRPFLAERFSTYWNIPMKIMLRKTNGFIIFDLCKAVLLQAAKKF
jgi:hypothetical protein